MRNTPTRVVFTRGISLLESLTLSGGGGLSRLAMIWHFRVSKQEPLKALTIMLRINIGFLQSEAYCRQLMTGEGIRERTAG